jgi:hypothetical protein
LRVDRLHSFEQPFDNGVEHFIGLQVKRRHR